MLKFYSLHIKKRLQIVWGFVISLPNLVLNSYLIYGQKKHKRGFLRPNLHSKSIYSFEALEKPPDFKFPGFADLIIAFFTIFTVIMQQGRVSKVIEDYPNINGLLFLYSITCSASTLHIAWRSMHLCQLVKKRLIYKFMLPSMVGVMGYFVWLLLYLIPHWSDLETADVAKKLLVNLFYPNFFVLIFHTWLLFAYEDFYSKGWKNLSSLSFVFLWAPYISAILNAVFYFLI